MHIFKTTAFTLFLILLTVTPASAGSVAHPNAVVTQNLNNPQLVGEGRLKVMFWNVFDARLHAEDGIYAPNEAFALSLTYLRELKGSHIVEKSMEEIERLSSGQIAQEVTSQWDQSLTEMLPDVSKGETITGVRTPQGTSRFYKDEQYLGEIDDPMFTQLFFSIWLGENSTQPALRNQLLGLDRTS